MRDKLVETWTDPGGWWGWVITVQNGPIANRYIFTAFLFFLVGGVEALIMRLQLARPDSNVVDPRLYNALFTMHGSTMMFLFAVPIMEAIANYLLPVLLGTRELPFPRMTAFGYWTYVLGGLLFYSSFLIGQAPDTGWTAYMPLSGKVFSNDLRIDFWLLGLSVAEVAAIGAGIELTVAILKMRAPGMTLGRMPIYAWSILVTGLMMLFGFTPLLVSTTLLELDRKHGTLFFDPTAGGDPLLWQHLFWMFGHPDVYIMFIPAVGMISMIVPTFARRPLMGHALVALAMVATGFLAFGLWVHHMFAAGLPLLAMAFFAAASFSIAIPSGIQVFAWIATIWSGRPVLTTSMLFALGFIVTFVIGGLTGVMVAAVPYDLQVHDSYFVVAHFHYVMVGGVVFPLFAALHYWLPGNTNRLLSERLGHWSFWFVFVGFNLTFFPMHLTGLLGMPRRYATYPAGTGWDELNLVSTVGSFVLGVGVLLFALNAAWNLMLGRGRRPPRNPWGAGTLDWATELPPPDEGYRHIPIVSSRYPLWQQSDLEAGDPETMRAVAGLAERPTTWRATFVSSVVEARIQGIVHLAVPSNWPIWAGVCLTVAFIAELFDIYPLLIGSLAAMAACVIAWLWPDAQERRLPELDADERMHGLPVYLVGPASPVWWAMVLVLVVAAVALALLVFSYFFLGTSSAAWPPPGIAPPGLGLAIAGTLAIAPTALALWFAERSIRSGDQQRLGLGLVGAFVCGVIFLAVQALEYLGVPAMYLRHAYGSAVLVLWGFASFVVGIGLTMTGVVLVQAWLGYFTRVRYLAIQNLTLYWSFAVVAWLVIVATVYVAPRLV